MTVCDIVDTFDTPGGHILLLLVVFFVAVFLSAGGFVVPKVDDIIVGSFAALMAKLSGGRSNSERRNGVQNGQVNAKSP
jgi:hypothetical protein